MRSRAVTDQETIAHMVKQESKIYSVPKSQLQGSGSRCNGMVVDSFYRLQMYHCLLDLTRACNANESLAEVSMNFADRFLLHDSRPLSDKKAYKLLIVSCAYVAFKTHETRPLSSLQISDLCGSQFSATQILDMEQRLLHVEDLGG